MTIFARFLILSLLLTSLASCGGGGGGGEGQELSTNACGTLGLNSKIINGTECETDDSPVVSISLFDESGSGFLCTGTLITATDVVTAAHCFPSEVRSAYIEANGARVFATQYALHPGFVQRSDELLNDVAILRLEHPVNLPTISLLRSRAVQRGDVIQIFGYGKTELGSLGALRSGEMEVSDVSDHHLTAHFGTAGSNTCQGDSGGPAILVHDGRAGLVGVTSFGSLVDCGKGDRSVFTNLQTDSYFNFIQGVVPSAPSF